jgi:hypothetical protein
MSEPSSSVPEEVADAEVEQPSTEAEQETRVELDVDEEKLEAWDDVKGDYQVEPHGEPVPNSMGEDDRGLDDSPEAETEAQTETVEEPDVDPDRGTDGEADADAPD